MQMISLSRYITPMLKRTLQRAIFNKFQTANLWSLQQNDWSKVVSDAEKLVGYPTSFMNFRCLLSDEMSNVALSMRKLVGTGHPLLKTARGLFFNGRHGTQMRGIVVLLMAKTVGPGENYVGEPDPVSGIFSSQRQLAEIVEMIHSANLIHKGVVDLDDIKDEKITKDMATGNKVAVLCGDFLLANACTSLAALRNTKVVEIISSSIADIMEAQFLSLEPPSSDEKWKEFTSLAVGSLFAKSCKSVLLLAGHSEEYAYNAFEFGKHLGFAYQLHQELLPFIGSDGSVDDFDIHSAASLSYIESKGIKIHDLTKSDIQKIYSSVKKSQFIDQWRSVQNDSCKNALEILDKFNSGEAKQTLGNLISALR